MSHVGTRGWVPGRLAPGTGLAPGSRLQAPGTGLARATGHTLHVRRCVPVLDDLLERVLGHHIVGAREDVHVRHEPRLAVERRQLEAYHKVLVIRRADLQG